MAATQLRRRSIRDERVLAAMGEIPREEFVPPESRLVAYADHPVPIGYGQTISQPYMTALMAELLGLRGTETVLEVGAGCGYAAAVLSRLAARVITVELIPALARLARENLRRTGRADNVTVIQGDGSWGYADAAPFAVISVAAAAREIPPALLEQLADPGASGDPRGRGRRSGITRAAQDAAAGSNRELLRCAVSCPCAAARSGDKMRLRTAKDRLKVEHAIIDGVRGILEDLLKKSNPAIRSVIPGVIRPVRDAKGKIRVRITVPTQNGWKAIALSAGARQELFVSTDLTKEQVGIRHSVRRGLSFDAAQ